MKQILLNRKLLWIVSKTISLFLFLGMSFTGCLETTREIPITLTVSTSALHFPFSGDEQTITIDSNTNSWKLSCDASWVTITPSSGAKKGTVTVRAHANEATENLSTTITITGTGILPPRTIPVSIGAAPFLTVTPPTLSFSAWDTPKQLIVVSNTTWTVSKNAEWLTVSPTSGANNGTISVTASAHTNTEQRSGTVSISSQYLTPRTVGVSQLGIAPINIDMVQVSGGTFTMGCTSEQGSDCHDWERPSHSVTLNTFYIGKFEVTQRQWEDVMGTTIRQQRDLAPPDWSLCGEGDNYPMYFVSWNEIVGTSGASTVINGITYYSNGFIYKLNQMTGKQYRLPTEAEWEYAARGGRSGGFKYSGSNTVGNVAWYWENTGNGTQPVGTKAANELGVFDMSGNVWEWCSDWFLEDYYDISSQNNPTGPSTGSDRVSRGGGWYDYAAEVRVSFRAYASPSDRSFELGFRLASSSN